MLPITSDFLDESSTSDEQSVNDNPDGDQSDAYSDSTLSSNGEEYHLAPNDLGYIRSRADYWHSRRNTRI